MSDASNPKKAVGWLEAQVERLSELRNAGTRDPGFREWRQNTLTIVQRVWSHIPDRSTRFRRIEFTPTSTRATDQDVRLAYEKGWGEARRLLKIWVTELESVGIVGGESQADLQEEPVAESSAEIPVAEPPSRPKAAEPKAPAPKLTLVKSLREETTKKVKEKLRDMLGFSDSVAPDAGASRPARGAGKKGGAEPAARAEPVRQPSPSMPDEFQPPPDLTFEPIGSLSGSAADPVEETPVPSRRPPPPSQAGEGRPPTAAPPVVPGRGPAAQGGDAEMPADPDAPFVIEQISPNPDLEPEVEEEQEDEDAVLDEYGRPSKVAPMMAQSEPRLEPKEPASPTPKQAAARTPAAASPPPAKAEPQPKAHAAPASKVTVKRAPASAPPPPPPPAPPSARPAPAAAKERPAPARAPEPTREPAPEVEELAEMASGVDPDVLAQSIADAVRRAVDELLPRGDVVAPPPAAPVGEMETGPLSVERFDSKTDPRTAPFKSAAARTMAKLAANVNALGVPAGRRTQVRARLVDLAHALDGGTVEWETLRDAMSLSMDFPPLACRVIPLLIAFLEDSA